MKTLFTSLLLTSIAATAHADTTYDMSAKMCGNPISDSSLTISAEAFMFYESTCAISESKAISDGVSAVTLSCGGEGETWTRAVQVEQTETGLRLTDETGTYDYLACK